MDDDIDMKPESQKELLFYNNCKLYPNAFGCKVDSNVSMIDAYKDSVNNFIDNACKWDLLDENNCKSIKANINNSFFTEENIERIRDNQGVCPRVSPEKQDCPVCPHDVVLKEEDILAEIKKGTNLSTNQYI